MKKSKAFSLLFLGGCLVAACSDAVSQTDQGSELSIFAAQRFWAASWDLILMDAQVVLPGGTPPPVVRTSPRSSKSGTEVVPISTIGARYGKLSVSTSLFGKTEYATKDETATAAERKEWDVAVGFTALPNLTVSVAYRKGDVTEGSTQTTRVLTGMSAGYDLEAWLLGLSASAPLSDRWSLYGNVATGLLKEKVKGGGTALGTPTYDGTYRIGEVGLSYRMLGVQGGAGFMKSLTAQFGYRAQVITVEAVDFPVFSVPGGVPVGNQKADVRSTTDGLIIGLAAAF